MTLPVPPLDPVNATLRINELPSSLYAVTPLTEDRPLFAEWRYAHEFVRESYNRTDAPLCDVACLDSPANKKGMRVGRRTGLLLPLPTDCRLLFFRRPDPTQPPHCDCRHIAPDFHSRGVTMAPPLLPAVPSPPAGPRFSPEFLPPVLCRQLEEYLWRTLSSREAIREAEAALGDPAAPQPLSLFPYSTFRENRDGLLHLAKHLAAGPFALNSEKLVVFTTIQLDPSGGGYDGWLRVTTNWMLTFWKVHGADVMPLVVCADEFTRDMVARAAGPGRAMVAYADTSKWCVWLTSPVAVRSHSSRP